VDAQNFQPSRGIRNTDVDFPVKPAWLHTANMHNCCVNTNLPQNVHLNKAVFKGEKLTGSNPQKLKSFNADISQGSVESYV